MKINSGNKRHVHTESDAKKEARGKSHFKYYFVKKSTNIMFLYHKTTV